MFAAGSVRPGPYRPAEVVAVHREVRDRGTWRTGHTAFTMYVLLAIALNLLGAASSKWADQTPMTERSMAADHTITVAPETLLQNPP